MIYTFAFTIEQNRPLGRTNLVQVDLIDLSVDNKLDRMELAYV